MTTLGRMVAETLRSLFSKPATVAYPAGPPLQVDNYRGQMQFDPTKCSGCNLCVKDCPASAITITKLGNKQFKCEIQLDHCIYCAQCMDSCVKKALTASGDFELAALTKVNMTMTVSAVVTPVDPATAAAAKVEPAAPADPQP